MSNLSLEDALDDIERAADGAVRNAAAVLTEAKRVKAAAASGQLRALRQSLESVARLADLATDSVRDLKARWTFDEQAYFASGAYTAEVLGIAAEEGSVRLRVRRSDPELPGDRFVVGVGYRRPDRQEKGPEGSSVGARADLEGAPGQAAQVQARGLPRGTGRRVRPGCRVASGQTGATVKLADIYSVLTVLPGSSRDYTRQELARDLYLLDQSGVTIARDGRTLELPASALTRGSGVLRTVTRSGQEKLYAGLSFTGGTP